MSFNHRFFDILKIIFVVAVIVLCAVNTFAKISVLKLLNTAHTEAVQAAGYTGTIARYHIANNAGDVDEYIYVLSYEFKTLAEANLSKKVFF